MIQKLHINKLNELLFEKNPYKVIIHQNQNVSNIKLKQIFNKNNSKSVSKDVSYSNQSINLEINLQQPLQPLDKIKSFSKVASTDNLIDYSKHQSNNDITNIQSPLYFYNNQNIKRTPNENYYSLLDSSYQNYKYQKVDDTNIKQEFDEKIEQIIPLNGKQDSWQNMIQNMEVPSYQDLQKQKIKDNIFEKHNSIKNPFVKKESIKRNLKMLQSEVVQISLKKKYIQHWLPPIQKLKSGELFQSKPKKQIKINKNEEKYINNYFNCAFKGKGPSLNSLFENQVRKNASGLLMNQEVIHQALKKEKNYTKVIEEYNRLLKIDQIKRLQIVIPDNEFENQKDYESHMLSKQIFMDNSKILLKNIKNDQQIIDRILFTIQNQQELLDFSCINQFYNLFIFQNSSNDEKINFMAKYFSYKDVKITMNEFMNQIAYLIITDNLNKKQNSKLFPIDSQQQLQQFELQLCQKGYLLDDSKFYRQSDVENIFSSGALKIDDIFYLLFNN